MRGNVEQSGKNVRGTKKKRENVHPTIFDHREGAEWGVCGEALSILFCNDDFVFESGIRLYLWFLVLAPCYVGQRHPFT